jgi:hypothetical protein
MIAFGASFAAAMWVIDRIFGDAAGCRSKAEPAHPSGLAPRNILLVGIADLTDGCAALSQNVTELT